MSKTFGIGFSIGAKLSPTVTTAFSTVQQKIKASAGALSELEKKSKALASASVLRSEVGKLQAQYAAGGGSDVALKAKLDSTIAAYGKAKFAADAYGVAVADYGREVAKTNKLLATHEAKLKALNSAKMHQDASADFRGRAMDATLPAVAMALPIGAAIKFESAMADVAKTMDGMRTPAGELTPAFYSMQNAVLRLGRTLPLTHAELAQLFAVAGQQGMTDPKEIENFATMAAHMGVAFGMANEDAANAIGSYRTALNMTMPEVRSLLDLMNKYANTSSATEKGIAEIVQRVGSLGNVGGVAAKPVAALAATLDSMKVAPEVAATGIKNLILAMTAGAAATKPQQEAYAKLGIDVIKLSEQMQKDGPAAIISVLEAVKKLPKAQQLSIMQQIFGKESLTSIAPLLDRLDLVRENLITAGDASAYAGAMQDEFNNRSKTTANSLVLAKNKASELGITLGATVLPALVGIVEALSPAITTVAEFASQNQGLTAAIVGGTVAFVALRPVVLAGMAAYHGIAGAVALTRAGMAALTVQNNLGAASMIRVRAAAIAAAVGAKAMAAGQAVLNVALTANPIGAVIMGVAALVAWFTACYNKVGSFRGAILDMWNDVKGATEAVVDFFSFGDDDDEEIAKKKAAIEAKKETALSPALTPTKAALASDASSADASLPPMPPGMENALPQGMGGGMGASMNFSLPISINGVTDGELAQGIFNALERNKSRFESLVSDIVNDQVRLAYGG